MSTVTRIELRSQRYPLLYDWYPNEKVSTVLAIQYDDGREEAFEAFNIEYLESGCEVFHLPDGRRLSHTPGKLEWLEVAA